MYEYRAGLIRVVDGDTIHALIDLGCDMSLKMTIRLARINAPELPSEAGFKARDYLAKRIGGLPFVLRTIKDKKERYGRYLGEIIVGDVNVNDEMVEKGLAVPYA